MYPAVDSAYRSPLNPATDGYIDIKIKNESNGEYTSLSTTAGSKSLGSNYVDGDVWDWGQNTEFWDTGST